MKKSISYLSGICLILLLAVTSACSQRGDILDTLPAAARSITVLNVKQIFGPDAANLSPNALAGGDAASLIRYIGWLGAQDVAASERVAIVNTSDDLTYYTFFVTDEGKFKKLLPESYQWGGDIARDPADTSAPAVMLADGQAWIPLHTDPAKLPAAVKAAKKAPVSKLPGIAQALAAEGLANVAVAATPAAPADKPEAMMTNVWDIIHAATAAKGIDLQWTRIKADGTADAIKGLQPIDTDVLAYVPQGFNFTFAAGLTPEFDWSAITRFTGKINDFQTQAALSVILPYLQSVNGTVLIAAAPTPQSAESEEAFDLGALNFMVMAKMPQQKIGELLGMVRTMMFSAGLTPRTDASGMMVIPQYGANLYLGTLGDYLALGTVPFVRTATPAVPPAFTGSQAAVAVALPSLRLLSPDSPEWGINLTGAVKSGQGQFSLTLPGSKESVIATILNTL